MTLSAESLSVRLGQTEVLHGIDLSIEPGEMVAVVGPNGSGKSTLVRTLAGILKPESGKARIDGACVHALSPRTRAGRLGLLTQSADTPGITTVVEHVGLGRHYKRSFLKRWTREDAAAVESAMSISGVTHLAGRRMEDLSGGERQRVRLATLLAQEPSFLLLDEPLTGLDIEHQLGLLHVLERLNADENRTIVCVLHDLDLALRFFRRVVVLHQGVIAAEGSPRDVLCPRIFESVFKVEGRVGIADGGDPVVVCRQCRPQTAEVPVDIVVRPGPIRPKEATASAR